MIEWYLSSDAGLEQGLTIESPPPRDESAGHAESVSPLVFEWVVSGADIETDGRVARFRTASGRTFDYGKLFAFDAAGESVPLHLESRSAPQRLRLVVDDRDARYPIVVDPLITASADQRVRSAAGGSRLGFSVSGAGDVNGDGYADLIVGASQWNGGQTGEGAAFLFLGDPAGLGDLSVSNADATFESNQAGAEMGVSVGSAGDVNGDGFDDLIVGARNFGLGGAAFIYYGSATGIASGDPTTADVVLLSDQASAAFGASVSGAGDVDGDGRDDILVGAYLYDAGEPDEGAAFVFEGSPTGIASGDATTASARLEGDQPFALMGLSVSSAGDVNSDGFTDVIIGAPLFDDGSNNEGAAFIFHGGPAGLASAGVAGAATRLQSDQESANFGFSVDGAGDTNGDGFDDVIIGADEYDNAEDSEGAAFVFLGGATGVPDAGPTGANAQLESNQAGADFGISVAGAGDIDSDGYADIVVGSHLWNILPDEPGAAFIYRGSALGIGSGGPSLAHSTITSGNDGARFGVSVAGVGDFDGDGFDDVLVGASEDTVFVSGEGVAYLFIDLIAPVPVPSIGLMGLVIMLGLIGVSTGYFPSPNARARPQGVDLPNDDRQLTPFQSFDWSESRSNGGL